MKKFFIITSLAATALTAAAQDTTSLQYAQELNSGIEKHDPSAIHYEAGAIINAGSGDMAPHYIMANQEGMVTQPYSTLAFGKVYRNLDTSRRLSWGAGVTLVAGWSSSADYATWVDGLGLQYNNPQHPARAWVQHAYVEGKYRGVFATLGQAPTPDPVITNRDLSSGDLTRSGNARPMPGLRAGFVDFQNIPLTNKWLQIKGEVGYYKAMDKNWINNHDNLYNHFTTTGYWMNYKNLYLRTNPDKRVVATVGMQAACQFGGTRVMRENGKVTETIKQKADAEAFFKALIPGSGGSAGDNNYYEGNHIGSWDASLDVNINRDNKVRLYWQSPWEDGSGIGKLNGFDGLYGIEFLSTNTLDGHLMGVAFEYLDFTNQSGPIHYAPHDHEGTPLTEKADGADDYYNNYAFNGYHHLGMSIGSPMIQGPIYNLDGYTRFADNMMRGFHVGVYGNIDRLGFWQYRVMASHRKSWGTPFVPRITPVDATSFVAECQWRSTKLSGLSANLRLAMDHGTLTGNNVGAQVTVIYHGNFTLGKK